MSDRSALAIPHRQEQGNWIFYPDYSHANPFQHLVYTAFPVGWRITPGTAEHALAALDQGVGNVVFHLHWEDAVYRDAPDRAAAKALVQTFLDRLDAIRARGGRIVWTVHNEAPHEPAFSGLDEWFRAGIASRANLVQMHSELAARIMAPALGIDPAAVLVTPLGGFKGYYPDDVSRDAARNYFGIVGDAPVFATIGAMRPYKGVDLVVAAFGVVRTVLPRARLILAGRSNASLTTRYSETDEGIILLGRQIDDCTVQYVMRAADWAVFAFRKIMVSSSILLPAGFDVPVIAPNLPTLQEIVAPRGMGILYQAGDVDALAVAMIEAALIDASRREAMIAAGRAELAARSYCQYGRHLTLAAMGDDDLEESAGLLEATN